MRQLLICLKLESGFQFFFQTVFIVPSFILQETSKSWTQLVNWRTASIVLSFASFAMTYFTIRYHIEKLETNSFLSTNSWDTMKLCFKYCIETVTRKEHYLVELQRPCWCWRSSWTVSPGSWSSPRGCMWWTMGCSAPSTPWPPTTPSSGSWSSSTSSPATTGSSARRNTG